jgi:hypothetical protein
MRLRPRREFDAALGLRPWLAGPDEARVMPCAGAGPLACEPPRPFDAAPAPRGELDEPVTVR